MSSITIKNYDTPSELTYPTSDIEIVTSAKLKKFTYTGELLFSDFELGVDARRSVASPTATVVGSAAAVGGLLELPAASQIRYTDAANVGLGNTFCIEFDIVPSWTGTPASQINVFGGSDSLASQNNMVQMAIDTFGSIRVYIYSSTGVPILNGDIVGTLTAVAGTSYHFSLNVDFTAGASYLFIDGVKGTEYISTGTRSTTGANFNVGAQYNGASSSIAYKIDNFRLWSSVQHTADYTPNSGYYDYVITSPSVVHKTGCGVTDIQALTISSSAPAGSAIHHHIHFNSVMYWWDGAAWSVSDGSVSESNTAAEITTNIVTFDASANGEFVLMSLLESTDGFTTPEITSFTIEYTFFNLAETLLKCLVPFEVYDSSGVPVEGAKVTIDINDFWYKNALIAPKVSATTDSDGKGQIEVVETETNSATANITIEYKDSGKVKKLTYTEKTIPNKDVEELSVIVA